MIQSIVRLTEVFSIVWNYKITLDKMGDSTSDQLSIESSGEVLNSKAERNGKSKSRRKELRSTEVLLKSMSHLTTDEKLKVCDYIQ